MHNMRGEVFWKVIHREALTWVFHVVCGVQKMHEAPLMLRLGGLLTSVSCISSGSYRSKYFWGFSGGRDACESAVDRPILLC